MTKLGIKLRTFLISIPLVPRKKEEPDHFLTLKNLKLITLLYVSVVYLMDLTTRTDHFLIFLPLPMKG